MAFSVESWDRTKPLVIDPTLVYSALFGGGTSSSVGYGVAVDTTGIYLTGYTFATDFPAVNAAEPAGSVAPDGYITKGKIQLPPGNALIYSTYLGGGDTDVLQRIAADATGAAWVIGYTQSSDFPLLNATQKSYGGNGDAIVAKFSSTGVLQFSTFLGGAQYDYGYAVATDSSNNVYATGFTESSDLATTGGALQTTLPGVQSAFVTKFGSSGSLVYSTYLGGTAEETAYAIAADTSGSAYVTGVSYSSSINGAPGGGAQSQNAGGGDAFVAKLNPAGSALSYFTFLGGASSDQASGITLESTNNAYITGYTSSAGLATSGAAQTTLGGGLDGFIAKLNPAGSAFTYITYLGGGRPDYPQGIGIDSAGNAYVAGYTDSNNFPSLSALQPNFPGNPFSLFQSLNNGTGWISFDTGISGAVLDISADPVTSGTIVVATENGIYRTTNAGTSWMQQYSAQNVVSLARSPGVPTKIYALQPDNIYVSNDNGITWSFQGSLSTYVNGLVADSVAAATVYAWSSSSGIFVSTNSGVSFVPANTGLPANPEVEALVSASDGTLYASVYGSGIYKSTNHGTSWTAVNSGLPTPGYFYTHSLTVSGTTVYVAGSNVYQTTNAGANWTQVAAVFPVEPASSGVARQPFSSLRLLV